MASVALKELAAQCCACRSLLCRPTTIPPTHPLTTMSCTVRLCLLSLVLLAPTIQGKLVEEIASRNLLAQSQKSAPFKACIDDSDCSNQGSGYACFQYICYPWADDSGVARADKKGTCKSNDDCSGELKCFRHHDRRNIHRGLCMEKITDCSENGKTDCKDGPQRECCNGQYCCGAEYFTQLKQLPCVNDLGCKDLGYGNFCCPPKGNKGNSTEPSKCCNTDPNPPKTTTRKPSPPKTQTQIGGCPSYYSSPLLLATLLFAVWRH